MYVLPGYCIWHPPLTQHATTVQWLQGSADVLTLAGQNDMTVYCSPQASGIHIRKILAWDNLRINSKSVFHTLDLYILLSWTFHTVYHS